MIWAKKRVRGDQLRSIELLFRDQVAAFDEHKHMLLATVDEDWPMITVYVLAPNEDLLSSYYGFEFCTRWELPLAPELVAGCQARFCQTFDSA